MTSEVENIPLNEAISFDSNALNGLRGFAAVHIMIFHSLLYSAWGFNTYGGVSILYMTVRVLMDWICQNPFSAVQRHLLLKKIFIFDLILGSDALVFSLVWILYDIRVWKKELHWFNNLLWNL